MLVVFNQLLNIQLNQISKKVVTPSGKNKRTFITNFVLKLKMKQFSDFFACSFERQTRNENLFGNFRKVSNMKKHNYKTYADDFEAI